MDLCPSPSFSANRFYICAKVHIIAHVPTSHSDGRSLLDDFLPANPDQPWVKDFVWGKDFGFMVDTSHENSWFLQLYAKFSHVFELIAEFKEQKFQLIEFIYRDRRKWVNFL